MSDLTAWHSVECDNCIDIKPCRRVTFGDDSTVELCAECEPVSLEDLQQALDVWSEGLRYTREHFVSDPTKFVGQTPVPVFEAAEDDLRYGLPVLFRVLFGERHPTATPKENPHE